MCDVTTSGCGSLWSRVGTGVGQRVRSPHLAVHIFAGRIVPERPDCDHTWSTGRTEAGLTPGPGGSGLPSGRGCDEPGLSGPARNNQDLRENIPWLFRLEQNIASCNILPGFSHCLCQVLGPGTDPVIGGPVCLCVNI